jgi:hypothetical protein
VIIYFGLLSVFMKASTFSVAPRRSNLLPFFMSCSDSLSLRRITRSTYRPHHRTPSRLWTLPIPHTQIYPAFSYSILAHSRTKIFFIGSITTLQCSLLDLIAASCKWHVAIGNSRTLCLSLTVLLFVPLVYIMTLGFNIGPLEFRTLPSWCPI